MNIHEYQAKAILKEYGVHVLNGYHISDEKEIEKKARRIETDIAVVKAQIHAGGRGKAGGVKLVESLSEAIEVSNNLFGKTLVTHQTGPNGSIVRQLYIEEGCDIKKEYYLSFVLDRAAGQIAIITSQEGGMDIEEIAEKSPEKIFTIRIDSTLGLVDYQIRLIINALNLPIEAHKKMKETLSGMYKCYLEKDCTMIEINPLVLTNNNEMIALDAKMNFDDNALFRQPEIEALRDIYEEDPKEVEASKHGLSYITLDGSIGCMVNGAGLAMATMDSIKFAGGSPSNFLDVGGSASSENVTNAFNIILSDSKVKGIFVNIFGGIMKCDIIAKGIVEATNTVHPKVPIVVRLEGTNEELGKKVLTESGLNIYTADSMDEGGILIVELSRKGEH
jgi:succinyl-CoA synthetase beta subunit